MGGRWVVLAHGVLWVALSNLDRKLGLALRNSWGLRTFFGDDSLR